MLNELDIAQDLELKLTRNHNAGSLVQLTHINDCYTDSFT
jgi:hypothetical protein